MKNHNSKYIAEGFWQYLEKSQNLDKLPEVLKILNEKLMSDSSDAIVYTGSAITNIQKNKIIGIVKKNTGINKIKFELDTKIAGGLKIKIGDEIIDLSLISKLNRLTANNE